jgi:hypothetical protein
MKKSILVLAFVFPFLSAAAQVSDPFFFLTIGEQAYTPLSNQNSLTQGIPYDDPEYIVPIGFDFEYLGYTYQTLYFAGVDSYGMELEFRGSDDTYPVCRISPCMLDIIDGQYNIEGKADSDIRYEIEGPPGNQVFKLEWNNVAFYNEGEPYSMRLDAQMWLYQSSGIIEFRYGPRTELDYNVILDYTGVPIMFMRNINMNDGTWEAAQALIGTPEDPEFTEIQNAFDLNDSPYLPALPNDGVVYTFSPLLVNLKEVEKNLRVFPNPVDDMLFIELDGHGKQDWQLTNGQGQLVMSGQTQSNTERLDVSNISAGVYFLNIFDNNSSHVEKVVIK